MVVEVKNKRAWLYPGASDVTTFLGKAAHLQSCRPDQLILPVLVARQLHYTLWDHGRGCGFLPARVENQLVLPDHELDATSLAEVRGELGYADLLLGAKPTNRHLGIFQKFVPRNAIAWAERWRDEHRRFLVASTSADELDA